VRETVSQQVEQRSSQAARQLADVAEAFRRTGRGLHSEGNDGSARLVESISNRAEHLSRYLGQTSSDRLLQDVEHFGRRKPWLVIAGGMALGIASSRLLKASSKRRFDDLRARGYTSREAEWPQRASLTYGRVAVSDGARG
jgi:hypothetical protein